MKAPEQAISSVFASMRRRARSGKRVEPRFLKMSARTRKRSLGKSPGDELLVEALAALVLLLAMLLVLLGPG